MGGWFVEELVRMENSSFKADKKLRGELATLLINNVTCTVFMPLSFMNLSGECVRAVCQFYRILPHEIVVAHDDLDLPVGRIRLKTGGGHGGHNGLRDMIAHLGHSDFHRLRIGIGHPGHKELVSDYVLSKPSQHDRQLIIEAIDRATALVPTIVTGHLAIAMNKLNREVNDGI